MAWEKRYRAAEPTENFAVETPDEPPAWPGTSCSTIAIRATPSSPADMMASIQSAPVLNSPLQSLRTFGIIPSTGTPGPSSLVVDGEVSGDDYVGYLDADWRGEFSVSGDLSTKFRPEMTGIPQSKVATAWAFVEVTGNAPLSTRLTNASFAVVYKDSCVVEVPSSLGGGWLMLLGRYRVQIDRLVHILPMDSTEVSEIVEEAKASCVASQSIGDIVAYWCDDPSFTGPSLAGPFPVVDSLDAVEDQEFRLWLGVPSGVFVQDGEVFPALYLYYVAEPTAPEDGSDASYPDSGTGYAGAKVAWHANPALAWNYPGDASTLPETPPGFDGGVVVSRFSGVEVMTRLAAAPPAEHSWRRSDAWTATLRKKVRVWVAQEGLGLDGEAVESNKGAYYDKFLRAKDPEPVMVGDTLNLFFSVPGGTGAPSYLDDPPSGEGVWRGVTIGVGEVWPITVGTATLDIAQAGTQDAEFGVDFVVACLDAGLGSRDLVARTYIGTDMTLVQHADPDVAHVPAAARPWLVWCSGPSYWEQYDGLDSDMDSSWLDAWTP